MADPKKDQDLEDVELTPNEGVDEEDLEKMPQNEDERESEQVTGDSGQEEEENPERAEEEPVAAGPVTKEDFEDLPEDTPREHTLDDLAEEDEPVSPGKPRSFSMDDEEPGFAASQIP